MDEWLLEDHHISRRRRMVLDPSGSCPADHEENQESRRGSSNCPCDRSVDH